MERKLSGPEHTMGIGQMIIGCDRDKKLVAGVLQRALRRTGTQKVRAE
jgi:hypothetical protein